MNERERTTSGRVALAVVGAGAMGANHARVVAGSDRARLALVVDADAGRAARLAAAHGARWSTDIAAAERTDAAIVATTTEAHVGVALALLGSGVPLLVEKPLAADADDAAKLVAESTRLDVPLTCGFVERWNPVVRAAADLLDEPPVHLLSTRHSPLDRATTTSVVHDLLIHDIDIALQLVGRVPEAVQATKLVPPNRACAELADATLRFPGGSVATLSASRLGQRKVRTVSITTAGALLELDLLRHDLTIYRHRRHEALGADATGYRSETVVDVPFVRVLGEPLALQLDHFLDLVAGRADAAAERRGLLLPHLVATMVETA